MKKALQQEFAERRTEFMRRIGKRGVAIIPAASEVTRSRDTHYRFRQSSDFAYLTGFEEPDAVAVIAPGREDGEFVLFVRPKDPEREIWDGRRAGPVGAKRRYGADQAFDLDQMAEKLPGLLVGREVLHYTLGEHLELDRKLAAWLRHLREVSRRGGSAPDTIVALDPSLHEMRLIKRPKELEWMRFAARVSAEAHIRAMRACKAGRYEWQIAAEIQSGEVGWVLHGTIEGPLRPAELLDHVAGLEPVATLPIGTLRRAP